VLVDSAVAGPLVEAMATTAREFLGGRPAESADFARIVNDRHVERLAELLRTAGGTIVAGGGVERATRFVEPTIILDPDRDAPIMQEEIFGPLLPVVAVASVDEATDVVNDGPKPLALYVFSSSTETVERVLGATSSGGVCVNHTLLHQAATGLPFGGVGASGMGAYHGRAGFDAYSHHKAVLTKPTKPELKVLYPPYTGIKDRIMRTAL
jgi:aldehyde dehydrogenase (NAD+)